MMIKTKKTTEIYGKKQPTVNILETTQFKETHIKVKLLHRSHLSFVVKLRDGRISWIETLIYI